MTMTRPALHRFLRADLLAAACALLLALLLASGGCYGDLVPSRDEDGGGAVGGDDSGAGGPDAAMISGDASFECADPTSAVDGHHDSGLPCRTCHDGSMAAAPTFTLGGTLYNKRAGAAGDEVGGLVVTAIDADGTRIDMPSGTNGNFWTEQAVAFPLMVTYVSSCPDVAPMMTVVSDGNCNANGCHGAGARVSF